MKILIIVTRMHARAGTKEDEFGRYWAPSQGTTKPPRESIERAVAEDRRIAIVDGCQFYDAGTKEGLTHAASVAADTAKSIPGATGAELIVLYHSRTLNSGTPDLVVREELEQKFSAGRIAGLYRYTGSELRVPPLSLLQDVVRGDSTGQTAIKAFDIAWSRYANAPLNLALEVLEQSYSRDGAQTILDRCDSNEINLPEGALEALTYIVSPDCETDTDLLEGMKSLKKAFWATLDRAPTPDPSDS